MNYRESNGTYSNNRKHDYDGIINRNNHLNVEKNVWIDANSQLEKKEIYRITKIQDKIIHFEELDE